MRGQLEQTLDGNRSMSRLEAESGNHQTKECDMIQNGVEGSVRLIKQLISTQISKSTDLGLIKKCNKEDAQKVIRCAKMTNDYLLKYIGYATSDLEYC